MRYWSTKRGQAKSDEYGKELPEACVGVRHEAEVQLLGNCTESWYVSE